MSKSKWWKGCLWTGVLFLALNTAACMKPALSVQYHNLTPLTLKAGNATENLPTILVGPVRVSSFLDQGPMVKQTSAHSSVLLEQHHWAGDLNEMLSRVIIQNLSLDLQHEEIYSFPDSATENGIRLKVKFFHFEKDATGEAFLEARWKIINNRDQSILKSATSEQRIQAENSGYEALTQSLSLGLAGLCHEIAKTIIGLQNNGRSHE